MQYIALALAVPLHINLWDNFYVNILIINSKYDMYAFCNFF